MALLVLIVMGATLGWLASIIARTEAAAEILRQIGFGVAVALVAGITANRGSALGGLSFIGLGVAIVAAGAALVLYHALLRRRADA